MVTYTQKGGERRSTIGTQRWRVAVTANLAGYLEEPDELDGETNRFAFKAAEEATGVLKERNDLATSILIGQAYSPAADLLRATGINLDEAPGALQVPGAHQKVPV